MGWGMVQKKDQNVKIQNMSSSKILISLATLSLLASQAQAKGKEKEQSVILSPVVVTATKEKESKTDGYKTNSSTSSMRTNTPLLDTPQSVSVVTQDQIRDQNITKMGRSGALRSGVNVQMGEGHRDQLTIRGMTNGSAGTTSNFFIDGARDDAEYVRDFYNTESIEFLKGPNAMAFGRGSPGGAVNRVSKMADGTTKRRLVLTGGSFDNRRAEIDLGGRVNEKLSLRFNSMYQKSNSYRDFAGFEKYGFNPTATIDFSKKTKLQVGYEHFEDARTIDRGIPAQNGVPYKTSSSSFFGAPNENVASTQINSIYGIVTHDFDATLQIRNNTRYTNNHKFYRNVVPGSISGSTLSLSAYQAKTVRDNFTNQTDLTKKFETGSIKHTALFGTELTKQISTKVRANGTMGSSSVSLSSPVTYTSVTYGTINQDYKTDVNVLATYLQDQIEFNKHWQLTAGGRIDHFDISFKNRANGSEERRKDTMFSPRAGLVFKPKESVSLYTSYGVTYAPSSGDQFESLTSTTASLKPEEIKNYEIGAKWDANRNLNFSAALFQLDRDKTPAADPSGSGLVVQTGKSRTRGFELAATGKITDNWQTILSYTFQNAEVVKSIGTTTQFAAGKKVALVPHNVVALWNKYDFNKSWAAALGVISQSSQFADASNSVRLKGFTRFDAALYYRVSPAYRLQLNVENIFDRGYYQTAHSATNILPGSPRAFKAALIMDF